jgi:hypothetical protein
MIDYTATKNYNNFDTYRMTGKWSVCYKTSRYWYLRMIPLEYRTYVLIHYNTSWVIRVQLDKSYSLLSHSYLNPLFTLQICGNERTRFRIIPVKFDHSRSPALYDQI